MQIRPVRFLPALVLASLPLVACDALKPKETSIDAGLAVATATATATAAGTTTAAPTDTTQPAATLGGATATPVPGQPAPHPTTHTDGGVAPHPTTTTPAPAFPTAIPGFDAGALRLPTGFDAGGIPNPFAPH